MLGLQSGRDLRLSKFWITLSTQPATGVCLSSGVPPNERHAKICPPSREQEWERTLKNGLLYTVYIHTARETHKHIEVIFPDMSCRTRLQLEFGIRGRSFCQLGFLLGTWCVSCLKKTPSVLEGFQLPLSLALSLCTAASPCVALTPFHHSYPHVQDPPMSPLAVSLGQMSVQKC